MLADVGNVFGFVIFEGHFTGRVYCLQSDVSESRSDIPRVSSCADFPYLAVSDHLSKYCFNRCCTDIREYLPNISLGDRGQAVQDSRLRPGLFCDPPAPHNGKPLMLT